MVSFEKVNGSTTYRVYTSLTRSKPNPRRGILIYQSERLRDITAIHKAIYKDVR